MHNCTPRDKPTIIGRNCQKYHFCHDKHKMFCHDRSKLVTTNIFVVVTNVLLWQAYFCHDKTHLLSELKYACHDKHVFVATNIFVLTYIFSRQMFCHGKHTFIMTKEVFCSAKNHFLIYFFVTTKIILVVGATNDSPQGVPIPLQCKQSTCM